VAFLVINFILFRHSLVKVYSDKYLYNTLSFVAICFLSIFLYHAHILYQITAAEDRQQTPDPAKSTQTQNVDKCWSHQSVLLQFLMSENITKVSGLAANKHLIFINHFLSAQVAILQCTTS